MTNQQIVSNQDNVAAIINRVAIIDVDDFLGAYKLISDSLRQNITNLEELKSVDFILVENFYKNYQRQGYNNTLVLTKPQDSINVLVLGNFDRDFPIIWEVSKIFADFYLEFLILPIITTISHELFLEKSRSYTKKIQNYVIVYDRKRDI
ncbi:hypothetical protein [Synechocystis sp. PCC 7509]|uniref:hypothetical protein n=1 Tax=Synechocystis sp. PCC 7509 TaxID=927677 RepID=UPI0002AC5593|nr:hypothetical protein [Synechocystis sp. PCC 7509]